MPPRDGTSQEREPLLNEGERNSETPFKYTPEELASLVENRDVKKLKEWGGPEKLLEGLRVDPASGLSSDEGLGVSSATFRERQKYYGRNVLPEIPQRSLFSLIWEAYQDKTLILLSIAAVISLVVGVSEDYSSRHPEDEPRIGWVEGAAILAAVFAVVFTNAINDYQKEKRFRKLNAKKEDRTVKLIRNGREQEISVYEINVGDILLIEPGDIIAVDGVYLSGHNLRCDESSVTGESDAIKKGELDSGIDPFILSGSKVTEGVGKAVVIAVGTNSFYGKTLSSIHGHENVETPLQVKLDHLAEQIAKLGVSAALAMLITLVLKYFIGAAIADEFPDGEEILVTMVSVVIQAITIVVVAVPEGLPMAVTLALAYATTQMLKDNNLVRELSACETMGNATAVCTDKTGTLTQNKMTVVEGNIGQKKFEDETGILRWKDEVIPSTYDIVVQGIMVNSSAFEGKDENGNLCFVGSKTECALLGFTKTFGEDYQQIRSQNKKVKVYPFASQRKTMTTIIKLATPGSSHGKAPANAEYRVHVKGASEIVLGHCSHYVDSEGKTQKLDEKSKSQIEAIIWQFAGKALRTICLAYRDVNAHEFEHFKEDEPPLGNLICLGIVGILDPLRPGVVESVSTFRKAGVQVRMITGDNLETARAIAKNAGILRGGIATTGPEFRKKSKEEQLEIVPRLQVLARSSPTDKTIVVSRLQELGEIVAVTGDGTNDGPALKISDVGFSMGIAGTEVAKEASDIILMDDNFNSIVKALKWGRAVNDSVRKFLQFQLTVNITAVLLSFISAVLSDNNESVLTAVQLLWVNLIMDTLAALALATEPPTDDLVNRKPTARDASLISYRMWKMIIGQAAFQIFVNLTLLHLGYRIFHLDGNDKHDEAVMRTIIFNTFVFLQVFNEINCRRIDDTLNVFRNLFNNHIFIIIIFIVVGGQYLIVQHFGLAFGTVPLTRFEWIATISIGFLSLPVGLIIRLIPNTCVPESIVDEEFKPKVSKEKMLWETGIEEVKTQLKVFNVLRKKKKNSILSRGSSSNFADLVGRVRH